MILIKINPRESSQETLRNLSAALAAHTLPLAPVKPGVNTWN